MASSISVSHLSTDRKALGCLSGVIPSAPPFKKSGTAARPYSLDRMQRASGQEAEDRVAAMADWLELFDDGCYRDDDVEPLTIVRKF